MPEPPESTKNHQALLNALAEWHRAVPIHSAAVDGGRAPRDLAGARHLSRCLQAVRDAALSAFQETLSADVETDKRVLWSPYNPAHRIIVPEVEPEGAPPQPIPMYDIPEATALLYRLLVAIGAAVTTISIPAGASPVGWPVVTPTGALAPRKGVGVGEVIPAEVLEAIATTRDALSTSSPSIGDKAPPSGPPSLSRPPSSRGRRRRRDDLDGAAAMLARKNPEWSKARIAKELGVAPSVLSDKRRPLAVFRQVLEQIEAERAERREGLTGDGRRDGLSGRAAE